MRVPLFWLQEWLPGEQVLSLAEIQSGLEQLGVEVEAIHPTLPRNQHLIVGRVESIRQHPELPHLQIAAVFDGTHVQSVVCGAANCKKEMKTVYAPVGSRLASEVSIEPRDFSGIPSNGMLCGWQEIGLQPETTGIVELPKSALAGQEVEKWLDEPILELGITPNLGHLLSIRGIARELAMLFGRKIRTCEAPPQIQQLPSDALLRVEVHSADCTAYSYCDISIEREAKSQTPGFVKRRLHQCGFRSLDLIVDVTNYIMLELGQPLHAYTLGAGETLKVCSARAGQQLRAIDHKLYTLQAGELVVELASGKVASLAGVIGAEDIGVCEHSQSILLESAHFSPPAVQRSSRQLSCFTEAAKRFERGCDAEMILPSLARAKELLEAASGIRVSQARFVKGELEKSSTLTCRPATVNRLLGTAYSPSQLEGFLGRLGLAPVASGADFICRVPSYRSDLNLEVDLVAEVARLVGIANVPRRALSYCPSPLAHDTNALLEKLLRRRCQEFGFCEILTDSLISSDWQELVAGQICERDLHFERPIKVRRPKSIEHEVLRTNLLPGFLRVVAHNAQRGTKRLQVFEIASVYGLNEAGELCELPAVGLLATGKVRRDSWALDAELFDFFHLKGKVEDLMSVLGIAISRFHPSKSAALHPGRQASLSVDGQVIGLIGQVHPQLADKCDAKGDVFFCQLMLDQLARKSKSPIQFQTPSSFPSSERDWTLTVKEEMSFDHLLDLIPSRDLLSSVTLLGIYQSPHLGADRKNLTLRFRYESAKQTLSQVQVDQEHAQVVQTLVQQLSSDLLDANLTPVRSRETT